MSPQSHFAVSPGWALLLTDLGLAPANVLRRARLPGDLFSRAGASLSTAEYYTLWEALEAEAEDPGLPLRIGRAISVEVFDPPIFAAICSSNFELAARRIARYKRLIGPLQLGVTTSPSALSLTFDWPTSASPPPMLATTEAVFWVALARLATRARVHPISVRLQQPPRPAAAYRDYFGVAVEPSHHHELVFSAADAHRPFLTANPRMWEFFEPELRRLLSELDAGANIQDRVHGALLELLPAGESSLDAVARRLAMSARTLQRRLRDEEVSYQAVLDRTREALARHYLIRSTRSCAEISFLLGYEEPASFYRAFRGWTGETPERLRTASARVEAG